MKNIKMLWNRLALHEKRAIYIAATGIVFYSIVLFVLLVCY